MSVSIDRTRIPRTYRDYLDTLKSMGELVEINDEVDWYLELGAIFRRTETLSPGAIFNKVKGSPRVSGRRTSAWPRAGRRASPGRGSPSCSGCRRPPT